MKSTETLAKELRKAFQIEGFLTENRDEFINKSLKEHLEKLLAQKGISKADVIKNADIDRCYGYQIFSGNKNPSRDKMLALSFGFGLNLDETQRLLKIAETGELYPRVKRDSIIMFCINKQMPLIETNLLLDEFSEYPIA